MPFLSCADFFAHGTGTTLVRSLHAISRKVAKTRYNIRLCRQPWSLQGINSVPVLMLCLSVDCTIFLYSTVLVFECGLHYLAIQYPCCHPLSCHTLSLLSPTILPYNILAVTHYLAIQYHCCHPLSCYTIALLPPAILLYNTVFAFGCGLHCLAIQYLCCHQHNFFPASQCGSDSGEDTQSLQPCADHGQDKMFAAEPK